MNDRITVIKPKSGWFDINLKELWHYRDLVMLFVRRTFVSQYKQTVLGPAWAVIQPLLTTVIFTVVFGGIAKLPTDGVPTFLFYLCGNVAWCYFSNSLSTTSTTFVSNASIFGKVYFPRLVMPVSTVITQLIAFAIQFAFFLIFWAYYMITGAGLQPNLWLLSVPLLLAEMAVLGLGFGIIISALTTKYRDLAMLVGFGVQLWMYASPVAYSASMIPEKWLWLYMLNPMSPVIETFRYAFFGAGEYNPLYLMISIGVSIAVVFVGVLLFSRVEKTFMDTI